MNLSSTLNKNEKVKQYIRKKTHKPIVLRFWVKDCVIPLCMFGPIFPSCEKEKNEYALLDIVLKIYVNIEKEANN